MTLNDVEIGGACIVERLNDCGEIRRRILDMGITKGTRVCVHKAAPLGDPIDVTVRGYHLSLRRADAANIEVKPLFSAGSATTSPCTGSCRGCVSQCSTQDIPSAFAIQD